MQRDAVVPGSQGAPNHARLQPLRSPVLRAEESVYTAVFLPRPVRTSVGSFEPAEMEGPAVEKRTFAFRKVG